MVCSFEVPWQFLGSYPCLIVLPSRSYQSKINKEFKGKFPRRNDIIVYGSSGTTGSFCKVSFSSVQFGHSVVSDYLQPHGLQHARLPCPSSTPRACSNSHPSSLWCHPTISSSVVPLSSRLQSFPASGSFLMSQLFTWGGQSTGVSALASFLPKKSQGWSPSEWTGWISLQSKRLSRVFSNITVQKYQFFSTQLSL